MSAGRPRNIDKPEDFLLLWDEYKKYVDDTPDIIEQATNKGVQKISVKRPYLRDGFQSYVYRKYGFHIHQYIDNHNNAYDEFLGVVTCVRGEWQEDQISGTLTGRYKAPNLTARLNGLTEKTDVTTNGNDIGGKIEVEIVRKGLIEDEES